MLEALIEHPQHSALLVDFDGTLSAIVDHPDRAVALPGVVEVLARLTEILAVVGVVSGRPVEFLRQALPVPGLELVGQYGLERSDGTGVVVDPRATEFMPAVAAVADRAETELAGVFVERKGTVAVTLHWRAGPTLARSTQEWATAAAANTGLTIYPTKMAVELRPPVPVDKGSAVAELAAGMTAVVFAGDDHGDLAAFDALDLLAATGTHTVRVAVRSSEEPPELVDRADLTVDGPVGALDLLTRIASALRARG